MNVGRYSLYYSAVRTPICKSRSGAFKNTPAEELLCAAIKGLLKRTGIDPCLVQDVVSGNVLAPGAGATLVRIASLAAGYVFFLSKKPSDQLIIKKHIK